METCARLGLPLIEDDPYGALSYSGAPMPKMVAMNPDGVIYMGSFSKVLTPGIRLGYVCAPLPLVRRLELAKQAADLHTAQITQMVVHEVIKDQWRARLQTAGSQERGRNNAHDGGVVDHDVRWDYASCACVPRDPQ